MGHNTSLTFYELRWYMDHPYFITLVLTVVADHTLLQVKKKQGPNSGKEPPKKPKPTSFIGKDYKSHLEDLLDKLSKVLVIMTRKINPDKVMLHLKLLFTYILKLRSEKVGT